ncbi:hypothetical protein ACFYM2_10950 [Streptomyces sp. NPDC006711]|uniref:hypothetical protein n=1 Tax=Streptomyces sp. NPDC006711 TaxID=3364762 RepID=UPI003690F706
MTWTKRRPAPARTSLVVRAAVSTATFAACGLLLAACSSSTGSPSASQAKPSASASASAAKGMEAYRQCLAQHGVTMAPRPSGSGHPNGSGRPSGAARRPGGGGGGFGGFGGGASADPAQRQAAQACASVRPQFNGGRGGGAGSTAMKAFTSCLGDHGVVLPSASPGGAGGGLRGLNTTDPKTAQAFALCKPLLPQRAQPPSPTATP